MFQKKLNKVKTKIYKCSIIKDELTYPMDHIIVVLLFCIMRYLSVIGSYQNGWAFPGDLPASLHCTTPR